MTLALPTSAKEAVALKNERRIFGPPGTGKTHYLTTMVAEYVESKKYRPGEIFITSFTKTAASNIASRAKSIPSDNVQTLHAAGYRALEGGEIAETHIDEWNAWAREHKKYSFRLTPPEGRGSGSEVAVDDLPSGTEGDKIFSQYMLTRARREPFSQSKLNNVTRFAQHWSEWKRETGYIDFQDMIDLPFERQLLPKGKPRVIICDEFQDFTSAEARLARFWGENADEIVMAGDDDQCIFRFKGADANNFIYPKLPDHQVETLTQSRRVPREVQRYAERWIHFVSDRQEKAYLPRDEDGEIRLLAGGLTSNSEHESYVQRSYSDPEWLLSDAHDRYLSKGKSVMFLSSCAYMLKPLIAMMRKSGVPFHNPYRQSRTDWNPLQPTANGISSIDRLLAYLRPSPSVWGNDARIWTIEDFRLWVDALQKTDVLRYHGKTPAAIKRYYDELSDTDPGALSQSLDVIEHLSEWLSDEALQNALDQSLDWFEGKLLAGKDGIKYPLSLARARGGATLFEKPNIMVGTIHSVKGGEADVVYLFPDISANGNKEKDTIEGRDTLVRLFYVGMTRAKETLVLCPAAGKYFAKFPRI